MRQKGPEGGAYNDQNAQKRQCGFLALKVCHFRFGFLEKKVTTLSFSPNTVVYDDRFFCVVSCVQQKAYKLVQNGCRKTLALQKLVLSGLGLFSFFLLHE